MNELYEKLLASKKYRDVCPDTIRRVITECEGRYKKAKDMEKAVREKLHGITSAFMTETEYRRASESESIEEILSCHASTRERMPLSAMDDLCARLFPEAPASILDLACGLNPVYLAAKYPDARITGVDISGEKGVGCADAFAHGHLLPELDDGGAGRAHVHGHGDRDNSGCRHVHRCLVRGVFPVGRFHTAKIH